MIDEAGARQKTLVGTPAELAAAREARGMSQVDISQRIKLQVKQVSALEEGRWEALPGKSFVRGALRSYGKFLDVDVAPLLESIGGFAEPAQVQGMQPLDAPISRSSGLGFNGGGRGSPILWVIAGLIGVVALVLYFGSDEDASRIRSWLPSGQTPAGTSAEPAPPAPHSAVEAFPPAGGGAADATSSPVSSLAGVSGPAAGSPAVASQDAGPGRGAMAGTSDGASRSPSVLNALQVLPQRAPSLPPAASTGTAAGASLPGALAGTGTGAGAASAPDAMAAASGEAARVAAPAAGSPTGTQPRAAGDAVKAAGIGAPAAPANAGASAASSAATAATAPAAATDTKGVVQFKAVEDAWVEVRQADGSALHNGLVKAGATIELKGNPPYRLVLGNASKVEVSYEGKVQDLAPHTRSNNIARLQLR